MLGSIYHLLEGFPFNHHVAAIPHCEGTGQNTFNDATIKNCEDRWAFLRFSWDLESTNTDAPQSEFKCSYAETDPQICGHLGT